MIDRKQEEGGTKTSMLHVPDKCHKDSHTQTHTHIHTHAHSHTGTQKFSNTAFSLMSKKAQSPAILPQKFLGVKTNPKSPPSHLKAHSPEPWALSPEPPRSHLYLCNNYVYIIRTVYQLPTSTPTPKNKYSKKYKETKNINNNYNTK